MLYLSLLPAATSSVSIHTTFALPVSFVCLSSFCLSLSVSLSCPHLCFMAFLTGRPIGGHGFSPCFLVIWEMLKTGGFGGV